MDGKIGRNDLCWCGSGVKYKKCHAEFDEKVLSYELQGHIVPEHNMIKTPEQIQGLRASAKINISVLDYVAERICAGISTDQIDQWVYDVTTKQGATPATLGYEGYPASVCTSVNDQVCHGIPSEKVILKEGDIVNVDVSTIYNGYFSDSSRMFCIGDVSQEKADLVRVTQECIDEGLRHVKPWGFLGDMGQAVHDHALRHGYSVVREIGGHGIGLAFHEEPWVSHVSEKGTEMLMVPGMVFTIEPMVNGGADEIYLDEGNGWTYYTKDGKMSAQWERMVLITESGYEIISY